MGWPAGEVEAFVRRRVLWVVLACLLAPVALYALLPIVAATGLTYFLHQQGTTTLPCNWDIQDGTRCMCLSSRSRRIWMVSPCR